MHAHVVSILRTDNNTSLQVVIIRPRPWHPRAINSRQSASPGQHGRVGELYPCGDTARGRLGRRVAALPGMAAAWKKIGWVEG
jgi:hypothetical protein